MKQIVRLICAVAVLMLSGCAAIVIPMTKRTEARTPPAPACDGSFAPNSCADNSSGHKGAALDLDFSFIRPGSTKQTEVEQKLAAIDSGAMIPGLFWGRFQTSSAGGGVFIAPLAGGTAGRIWLDKNIWVEYDDTGTVTSSRVFSDARLSSAFAEWFKNHPAMKPFPLHVLVTHTYTNYRNYRTLTGMLAFNEGQIIYDETGCTHGDKKSAVVGGGPSSQPDTCDLHLVFPQSALLQVSNESNEGFTPVFLFVQDQRKIRLSTTKSLTAGDFVDLLAYLHKYCPGTKIR